MFNSSIPVHSKLLAPFRIKTMETASFNDVNECFLRDGRSENLLAEYTSSKIHTVNYS